MLLDPLMEKSVPTLLGDLPKRLLGLISKLLSMKALVFLVATVLLLNGHLPTWAWLSMAVIVILGREADKHLPALFNALVKRDVG